MTTTYDIVRWQRCQDLANSLDLKIQFMGDKFMLRDKGLGAFPDVDALFLYLCGYEAGLSTNKKGKK